MNLIVFNNNISKKYIKIIIAIMLLLAIIPALFSCGGNKVENDNVITEATDINWEERFANDSSEFAKLYPVTADNPFVIATFDEVMTFFEWGTGVLAFGHPRCPRCKNAFPILEKAFTEMNMERYVEFHGRILYYDIYDDRDENNERYQTLVELLSDYLIADDNGDLRIFVPDIYFVGSGRILGNHRDTVASVIDPEDPLTEEQETELLNIYKTLIEKVEDCEC